MDFNKLGLSVDIAESLEVIYQKAKKISPALTRESFLDGIIKEWLEPYSTNDGTVLPKGKVILKNNLKQAINLSGKSQAQVARESGISRSYLSQIISGKYDVSVKMALILTDVISYPPEKFRDIFFLEPAEQD